MPEVRLPDEPAVAVPEESSGAEDSPAEDDLEICHPGEIISADGETAAKKAKATAESSPPRRVRQWSAPGA